MSAVTYRPTIQRVKAVNLTQQQSNTAQVVQSLVQGLSQGGQSVFQALVQESQPRERMELTQHSQSLQSPLQIQQCQSLIESNVQQLAQAQKLSALETVQLSTLMTAHQLAVESPQSLQQVLQPVLSAPSLAVAQSASLTALQQVSLNHQDLCIKQLTQSCIQAASHVGFTQLVQSPTLVGHTIRLVANDETGKSLVTEIRLEPEQDISLATELIGTSDHVCQEILNAYDRALEEAGVYSGPPERKFTGGIYELDAARDFVRHTVKPRAKVQAKANAQQSKQTRSLPKKQRLNQQQ